MTTQKPLIGKLISCLAFCGLGLPLALQADDYVLNAGASDTLTSETAETTTYDSMSIAGSLTVSGKKTVASTGTVTVVGGTVTVSGNAASIGKQGSNGCNWNLASDGKIIISNGKSGSGANDFSVGAKDFAILDSCEGQDGYIDFMEINGGEFRPHYIDNYAAVTARIKVSGMTTLKKGSGNARGRGLVRRGAFEILLQDSAQLIFDVRNQQGSLNGGTDSSENSVDIVGSGDVTFKMQLNDTRYPYSLRTGAKLNHVGSVMFCGIGDDARFSMEGDDTFGANVTNIGVAAEGGSVTLEIAEGTTQTVRRLSFLREGKDDVITGAGTLCINAIDADAVFEARLADDAALTVVKTGSEPVTASGPTNYPALNILAGSFAITNDCTVGTLTLGEGATLVVDGAAVHVSALDNAGGTVSYLNGGTLDFHKTVLDGETEEIRNWTMNGGTGFVKDGTGTLHLYDPAITGKIHVAEGTLSFSRHGLLDTYYHLVFKEQCAFDNKTFGNFYLRKWFWYAPNAETYISSPRYGTLDYSSAGEGASPNELEPGEVTFRQNGDRTVFKYRAGSSGAYSYVTNDYQYIHYAFIALDSTAAFCFYESCSLTNAADSANWLHLWVRLPDKEKYANGIDGFNSQFDRTGSSGLTAWTIESSATGEDGTWKTVSDVSGYVPVVNGSGIANNDINKPQALFSYTQQGVRNLADTLAVQVDSGAILDFTAKTGGQTIDRIVYDVSKGGGTIRNVVAASTGVMEIATGGGAMDYCQPLPIVFAGVSDTANFMNWTVTVDGAAVDRKLVFRNGALAFSGGMVIIFK